MKEHLPHMIIKVDLSQVAQVSRKKKDIINNFTKSLIKSLIENGTKNPKIIVYLKIKLK